MGRLATCAIVSIVATFAAASVADAGKRHKRAYRTVTILKTFPVEAHYREPPGTYDGVGCNTQWLREPETWSACRLYYSIPSTWDRGTFLGDARTELLAWQDPDRKLRYEGFEYVTGEIVGCGKGSFIIEIPYGYVDFAEYDAATGTAPGFNDWHIRPGSGSGGLSGLVSGSGQNHWTSRATAQDETFGDGTFTGSVTCRVTERRPRRARGRR